jgi:hypothetical protein
MFVAERGRDGIAGNAALATVAARAFGKCVERAARHVEHDVVEG